MVLGIPVLIAVILRFFGDNKYEIPVFYENGIINESCNIELEGQYVTKELIIADGSKILWNNTISICYFYTESNAFSFQSMEELARVFSTNRDPELLHIYTLGDETELKTSPLDTEYLRFSKSELEDLAKCRFLIESNNAYNGNPVFEYIVLIDKDGKIRGYYDSSDPDEYDRLSAEVDILKLEMQEEK